MKDKVAATWKDTFYPGGIMTAAHVDYKAITDERVVTTERAQSQALNRQVRDDARKNPDTFDMLMTLSYIITS